MNTLPPTLDFLRHLWLLSHALERRSSQMQVALGITAQQRMVLRCLGVVGAVHAGALAELLHLDRGTLSATLRRLEERGLVRRVREDHDSRRVRVELTAEGQRLDVPTPHTVESAAAELLARTSAADIASATRVVSQFAALLMATPPLDAAAAAE